MKKFITIALVLTLISLTVYAQETASSDTLPSASDSATPSVADTVTSQQNQRREELTQSTTPATETFSYKSKGMQLQFEFPLSWKEKLQTEDNSGHLFVYPPGQNYGVPEKSVYLSVGYLDNPWVYGDTFEQTTSEETIETKILYINKDKGEKIIEKSPLKIMDRDAWRVTYSKIVSEGKSFTGRLYLIDDERTLLRSILILPCRIGRQGRTRNVYWRSTTGG